MRRRWRGGSSSGGQPHAERARPSTQHETRRLTLTHRPSTTRKHANASPWPCSMGRQGMFRWVAPSRPGKSAVLAAAVCFASDPDPKSHAACRWPQSSLASASSMQQKREVPHAYMTKPAQGARPATTMRACCLPRSARARSTQHTRHAREITRAAARRRATKPAQQRGPCAHMNRAFVASCSPKSIVG